MAPSIINKILGKEEKNSSTSGTSSTSGQLDGSSRTSKLDSQVPSSTGSASTTTADQTIAPAVQHERINRVQQEEVQTVVDRERHQDHYHTTVQPVTDNEVLPEKHVQNRVGTEHREFDNRDSGKIQERLAAEQAQFKNTRTEGATQHTTSQGATTVGEHTHHHVHETVQPVIEKEIVQPTVTHTTVPIHETHHEAAKHHTTTTAPTISMDEFQNSQTGGNTTRGI